MNEIIARAGLTMQMHIKANRRLKNMVQEYFLKCRNANDTVKFYHRKKDLHELIQICQIYVDSIPISTNTKAFVDKIYFIRGSLEDLMPNSMAYQYGSCQKLYNSIIQYCCEEKQSRKPISALHLAELTA